MLGAGDIYFYFQISTLLVAFASSEGKFTSQEAIIISQKHSRFRIAAMRESVHEIVHGKTGRTECTLFVVDATG